MPILFTRDEIKDFLEENGFDITDSATLNKFIKDLKKVIKYETYRRRRQRLGHDADDTVLDSTDGRRHHQRSDGRSETTESTYTNSTSIESSGGDDVVRLHQSDLKAYLATLKTESGSGGSPGSGTGESAESGTGTGSGSSSVPSRGGNKGGTPTTPTAGTSSASGSSYYYEEEDDGLRPDRDKMPPLTSPPPPQPRSTTSPKGILANNLAQKKTEVIARKPPSGSKRLIMKRVTASVNETGDSVIEESDIDYGPIRRQPKSQFTARPHTAPTRVRVHPSGGTISKQATRYNVSGKTAKPPRPVTARDEPRTLSRLQESGDTYSGSGTTSSSKKKHHRSSDEIVYILKSFAGLNSSEDDEEEELELEDEDVYKRKKVPLPPPHIARDPVLLYHWYKTKHWDVYSIPGEDRHMQLRWNIRAKTIGAHIR